VEVRHFVFQDLEKQALMPGLFERTAIRMNGAIATINWFQPGFPKQEMHHHPFDQLVLVVAGKLRMFFSDREIIVEAGSAVYIPPDVPHTAVPAGNETVVNIDIFSPPRSDYLFLAVNQEDWGPVPDVERGSPFSKGEAK
jgi:mannose-6-phosphate isomerase-like protein (cupin superfamily)